MTQSLVWQMSVIPVLALAIVGEAQAEPCAPGVPVQNDADFCRVVEEHTYTIMELRQAGMSKETQRQMWFDKNWGEMTPYIERAIDMSYVVKRLPEDKQSQANQNISHLMFTTCMCVDINE